ncbi:5-hydroxytryptamine receptor 3A [Larimichthys crocea]|uniref:5-hydroxytryptamine receptor 3A n=1 Tax=Larimichthys crocea TaxID=215358 RepID=A0A6G0IRB7_LARCR|nr:5-hydroxytryptamine receptor 3A [Larimichthys crocea]
MKEIKKVWLIFICFSLLHGFVAALNCTSPTPESLLDALKKEVFTKKLLRPVKRFSDTLNVSLTMRVAGIIGVNEKEQTLTILIWQIMVWPIDGLSWDEKLCGTARVSVPRKELWIPDIYISQFMDEDESPKTFYVYLDSKGHAHDGKPVRVVSACRFNIYTFPFDVQNCTLTFGPYLHYAQDVRLVQINTAAEVLEDSRNVIYTRGEWELVDIQAVTNILELSEKNYSELRYYLILSRRPRLYIVNLIIPSVFLSILDLFSFLLPPQSVDRSAFKMTLILGYTVFLNMMSDLLPVTGNQTPLLNVLILVSFALMVVSLLETVFVMNIQHSSSQYSPVPHWLSVLVLRYIAVAVCLPPQKKSNRITVSLRPPTEEMNTNTISLKDLQSISGGGDTPPEKPPPGPVLDELRKLSRDLMAIRLQIDNHILGSKTSQEWHMIGIVIDRLLFGLYIVVLSVCFITIIALWFYKTETWKSQKP